MKKYSVEPKCPKHPKYKAKMKPLVKCEICWKIWELKNKK